MASKKNKLTAPEAETLKGLAAQQEAAAFACQRYLLDLLNRRGLKPDQWRLSDDLTALVRKEAK